jgi:uncharacterized protein YkwD
MKYLVVCLLFMWGQSCTTAQSPVRIASKSVSKPGNTTANLSKNAGKDISPVPLPDESGNFRKDMLNMVNAVREQGCKCGRKKMPPVAPLKWNALLEKAAMAHAEDMADNDHFDHVGTDGSEIDTRINRTGYKWMQIGENIAWGYDTVRETIIGWIKSPSHCQQMMSNKVTEMGASRNGKYWVQEFGKQRNW